MRLLILPALLFLSACASHKGVPPGAAEVELQQTDYQVVRGLRYSPDRWPEPLLADVYRPLGAGPFPAVLVVHGGGWEGRSPEDMAGISERLATNGFVAVNIAYRFAPQYRFPAQLHDLQQAMHWIHQRADEFAIDRSRVAALGYSAGAHLVSLLGLVAGTASDLDVPYGGAVTRPYAVVAGGTPSDLRKFTGGRLVPQFLGGTIEQMPEAFAQASPVVHVHDNAPPFFIYHGAADLLVADDHATDFYAALRQQGVPAELYLLRLRGHFTAFALSGSAIDASMRFLQRSPESLH
ncbi:alpha/beta hydrolase fold domain-containing protein [Litorivivens sp.]|uniref:alpha/beta hydrolase fold domain-containing protein n=1 Tax=Litorivivens sp. TaxID=2020868 RepID=UPI003569858D